jgi:hypothetical protein
MKPPRRVKLSRRTGYRMPTNSVKCARPAKYGNPFVVAPRYPGWSRLGAALYISVGTAAEAKENHRKWLVGHLGVIGWVPPSVEQIKADVRGKNLACFCDLDEPCHCDTLLEIANS